MSHLLWKYYWENDVDKFRRLLAPGGYSQTPSKSPGLGVGVPGAFGISPRSGTKSRKGSGFGAGFAASRNAGNTLGKAEINSRDYVGLTILLRAASSMSSTALAFVEALLEHPSIDIYVQDPESGWNALHRALYSGNISVARALLEKERRDLTEAIGGGTISKIGQLIKTKDHEGNSPFDVYNATIALRSLKVSDDGRTLEDESESEEDKESDDSWPHHQHASLGEEVFTFGSNKNLALGLGDEDDRQFPERIYLRRPENLIRHFHNRYLKGLKGRPNIEESAFGSIPEIPTLIRNRPLVIQDVVLSKLHSAVLTTDPISNLYICGIGRGGRLGLGDENTRFTFTPVQGGLIDKKIIQVALGQNHSMAVTKDGELWTWGSNIHYQLGYALPTPSKSDEEPISTTPRQIFGPLKKEIVLGAAASSIHSVAHTGSSLFCWGKNVGQLALMDADSRSLEVQVIPRKVAATLLSSHSSILTVSAIDRATSCLFEDRSVCVFTSYGYNMIKFPFSDGFTNSPLQRSSQLSLFSRHEPDRREIHHITSGGDTIAAITGGGDLFTMQLSHKFDGNAVTTSTTNPAKIKDAITLPQCVWSSRKDGVKSASVGEHGSVIISTQSGAVWRRIQRTKAKDTRLPGAPDSKRKDFKFQRVPYITDVVGVRSSTFGTYAAIRKDCDVTREQLEIPAPTLWNDLAPLCALRDFKALNSKSRENKDTWESHKPDVLRGRVDPLAFEVLTSTDLEEDLGNHLMSWKFKNEKLGTIIRSKSNPELAIPVHSWALSGRSPIVRAGLQHFREDGTYGIPEVLSIREEMGETVVELTGSIDMITLLNLVVYIYSDRVIPAWNFTRQSPSLAYRYRQVRAELMKLATRLGMMELETAVRLQKQPLRSMNEDFEKAIDDPAFFEDGDLLLELDGDDVSVHSSLICERCPWFQGLFNGRSRGMWLESRRMAQDDGSQIDIDLQHMDPESFRYVLRYLYADVGEELFDNMVSNSIDDFSELVLDVMSIANELMLDRLSQICQKIIGRFVTSRNVSTLLNAISPCSVSEFKNKGLEYICLQMETMLENHLLDNLDEDLLLELDEVVRDNQLARCPFARSGRAELLLFEQNPGLAQDIEEERVRRVKEIAFKATQKDDERKLSTSFKTRFGSQDDLTGISPAHDRARRAPRISQNEPFSPDLRPKDSHVDLIFDMDDEEDSSVASPVSPSPRPLEPSVQTDLDLSSTSVRPTRDYKGKAIESPYDAAASPGASMTHLDLSAPSSSNDKSGRRESQGGNPWKPPAIPTSRLDLREVLAESRPVKSALSAQLAAEKQAISSKSASQRMSQKERKKQQQAEEAARREHQTPKQPEAPWTKPPEKKGSPWQKKAAAPKLPAKEVLEPSQPASTGSVRPKPLVAAEASSSKSIPRRTASPDTRFSGQKPSTARASTAPARPDPQPLMPHSKSYIKRAPKPEQEIGLGLADIIGQQRREQESVREAVAKRSLQEIQEEQAFQEWWDQESRRTQEEEAQRTVREAAKDKKKEGPSKQRSRGNKARGGGKQPSTGRAGPSGSGSGSTGPATGENTTNASSTRGRGRGHRGGKAS